MAKPTQIRPTEQRNDVNSVKKQIPKEPVKEPKEASCSPKVNGTTNDKPAPTEQVCKTKLCTNDVFLYDALTDFGFIFQLQDEVAFIQVVFRIFIVFPES